jgi:hypothetical protein
VVVYLDGRESLSLHVAGARVADKFFLAAVIECNSCPARHWHTEGGAAGDGCTLRIVSSSTYRSGNTENSRNKSSWETNREDGAETGADAEGERDKRRRGSVQLRFSPGRSLLLA